MTDHPLPNSSLRLTLEQSEKVKRALSEILPGDRYSVAVAPGMGFDGVLVTETGVSGQDDRTEETWYFDNTYDGTDGHSDHLRVYFTAHDGQLLDDLDPSGAPQVDEDPIEIARWIERVVRRGPPAHPG